MIINKASNYSIQSINTDVQSLKCRCKKGTAHFLVFYDKEYKSQKTLFKITKPQKKKRIRKNYLKNTT